MMSYKKTVLAAVACLSTSVSQAAITSVTAIEVPNTLAGYVTTDLFINFDGPYYGSQLYLNGLQAGQVYQHPGGSDIAPNPAFIDVLPELAFDTFLAQGGPTSVDQEGGVVLGGWAADLTGYPTMAAFSTDEINQSWFTSPGTEIIDQTNFMVARITLSDQANGMIFYSASAGGEVLSPLQGQIVNGSVCGFCEILYGDYNNSEIVSAADLDLVLLNWGDATPPIPAGWENDLPVGLIGQEELDGVLLNWGNRPAFAVPEPTSLLLYGLGLIGMAASSHRRNQ